MTILQVQIAVKHYFRKTENNLRNAEPVIPGLEPAGRPAAGPMAREPGIHNHDRGLWIPGLRQARIPE